MNGRHRPGSHCLVCWTNVCIPFVLSWSVCLFPLLVQTLLIPPSGSSLPCPSHGLCPLKLYPLIYEVFSPVFGGRNHPGIVNKLVTTGVLVLYGSGYMPRRVRLPCHSMKFILDQFISVCGRHFVIKSNQSTSSLFFFFDMLLECPGFIPLISFDLPPVLLS